MVDIAQQVALISDPDFLILDEPTNGLDPQGIVDLRVFLRKLAAERGVTLLISSHIQSELSQLATRFLIIDRGRIVESLTREELQAKETRHISFACAADPSAALERLAAAGCIAGHTYENGLYVLRGPSDYPKILRELSELPVTWLGAGEETLESYFVKLVGGAE